MMDFLPLMLGIAAVFVVPGLIFGMRKATFAIGALTVAVYAALSIRVWVWAVDCWGCRYEGPFESVYNGRGDALWTGFGLLSLLAGFVLGGLLLGAFLRAHVSSQSNSN